VQVQADFSSTEAEFLYTKAKRDVRKLYWQGLWANLKNRQVQSAWTCLSNGPGAIKGLLIDPNSNVLACIKYRNGERAWRLVLEHRQK